VFLNGAGNGVAFNPASNVWVAVGSSSNMVNVARSLDGRVWSPLASVFSVQGNAVAYSSQQQRWVAVGEGVFAIAYSLDNGQTWSGIGAVAGLFTVGRGVLFSQNSWIAFGSGGIQSGFSSNGVNWNATVSANVFPSVALGAAAGPSGCVLAVGDSSSVLASSCNGGLSFTAVPTFFPSGGAPTNTAVTGGPRILFDSQFQLFLLASQAVSTRFLFVFFSFGFFFDKKTSTDGGNWTLASGSITFGTKEEERKKKKKE
jgi:hypothetical protein